MEWEQTAGGIIFSLLLLLSIFWIAKRKAFFRLPPVSFFSPITFLQTLGAFLTYLIFAFLVLPIFFAIMSLWIKGEIGYLKEIPLIWKGWIQFAALCVIFVLLVSYCFLINSQSRRYIFWGEGERSVIRFFRSLGMGVVGWIISYPFVLVVSILGKLISVWIWGDVQTEQVAVKQLKMTMDNPYLFGSMIFAVVVLVPFLEELLFRGFFQNFLKRYLGRNWAIFVSGAVFAVVHFSPSQAEGNFQLILSLLCLAFFLGFIYERQRTLWAPIALHMAFNGISVIFISLK